MATIKVDMELLRDLKDEKLPWLQLHTLMSGHKDTNRFFMMLDILKERVSFEEKIVLPLSEHLYIVKKDENYIVKCDCGHEFCDHQENWKLEAMIHVRNTEEELLEIYPKMMTGDPQWCELREYFCPGCMALLEVESVPPGYPIVFNFKPDLHAFYKQYLGVPLP
jgi:acetone carboxylase gamma subunit